MAPKNTFSLKFTSDGLSDVLKASEKVRLSYEDWIESAEKSIKEANKLAEEYAGNQEKLAEAEELKAKAAKTATRAVAQSYRELGVTSTKSIEDQKQRAISAFEAIKRSGVASAEDIDRAQKSLQERLKRLDGQLDNSADSMRDLGREAERTGGEFTILKGAIAGTIANLASGLVTKGIDSMVGLGRSAIATRTEFSKLRDQIALLEGGEAQGKTVFDRLQEFNKQTPFELREVTQAYITLANRGVKQTNEQLTGLGDRKSVV
jgi:phage tail tape-measure protein